MSAPSISRSDSSSVNTAYTYTKRMLVATRPAIEVSLNNHFSSKVYTSSSVVSGVVNIRPEFDMPFDNFQILLTGTTKTQVDMTAGQIARSHLFLKLSMPIPDDRLPVPRIFEAGETYTYSFNFVIPNYLTINACGHHVSSDHVKDAHLFLPPSMGYWERDDMAPNMAHVEYVVKARISQDPRTPNGKPVKLAEACERINVLPASYEEAPLSICKEDKEYRMCRTKSVKKSMFSQLGKVTASATQPSPVVLRADGRAASGTTASVNLKFDPASADSLPPQVASVSSKLSSVTYFSNDGFKRFPNIGQWCNEYGTQRRGRYSTSVSLPTMRSPKTKWNQHVSGTRRDSGYGSDFLSSDLDSDFAAMAAGQQQKRSNGGKTSPLFHSTTLSVPVVLPTDKKTFIPSFHSCIASRVYVLHLAITLVGGSTINLSVPLQVAVEAADAHQQGALGLPSFEAVVEQEEAEMVYDMFVPRTLRVPDAAFQQQSELPSYDEITRPVPATAR